MVPLSALFCASRLGLMARTWLRLPWCRSTLPPFPSILNTGNAVLPLLLMMTTLPALGAPLAASRWMTLPNLVSAIRRAWSPDFLSPQFLRKNLRLLLPLLLLRGLLLRPNRLIPMQFLGSMSGAVEFLAGLIYAGLLASRIVRKLAIGTKIPLRLPFLVLVATTPLPSSRKADHRCTLLM